MKETRIKIKPEIPYSLHDMRVNKLELVGDTLKMYFEEGFTKLEEPYDIVKGHLEIEKIDLDFTGVYVGPIFGRDGGFRGKKYSLLEFVEISKDFTFEIVDEYYGYSMVGYAGYIWENDKPVEFRIDINYFTGDILYIEE